MGGRAGGAWAGGSTRGWRRTRARVLAENQRTNHGRCVVQVPGVCTSTATCVHHVLGRGVTGDDPRYLVAACKDCNGHVGKPSTNTPKPRKITRW